MEIGKKSLSLLYTLVKKNGEKMRMDIYAKLTDSKARSAQLKTYQKHA